MGKLRTLSGVLVILSIAQVHSFPRKKLVNSLTDNSRSSKLASVLSDYWTERGFHEARTDHLLASESEVKDLMLTGDDDFRGKSTLRIPRGRLTPPGIVTKHYSAVNKLASRQQRKRLRAPKHHRLQYPRVRLMNSIRAPNHLQTAQRKQDDMEIMESVTLVDGGTPHSDGTITVQASPQQSQRKYQQGHTIDEDQISPLNYQLQDDDLTLTYKQIQQQYHQGLSQARQPVLSASYHALPNPSYSSGDPQGKLSLGQYKQPKSIPLPSMSLNQFQQQLFQQQQLKQQHQIQQQQHQQIRQPAPVPPAQPIYSSPKPQVVPLFIIPAPQKQQPQAPSPQPQPASPSQPPPPPQPSPFRIQTTPPPPPPSNTLFNQNLFQQQFKHPFATQAPSQISSLAQLTATLLSGASTIAAATSSAAAALAKGELPIPTPPTSSPPSQPAVGSAPYASYAELPPSAMHHHEYSGLGPLSSGILAAASIPSASQILLPTTQSPYAEYPSTSPRPGVIADEEQILPNSVGNQPESLTAKINQLVETGRKILYFPKGVMDTMDVFLKQMERNPMVAYWGDKFFAKVFGDTSGT